MDKEKCKICNFFFEEDCAHGILFALVGLNKAADAVKNQCDKFEPKIIKEKIFNLIVSHTAIITVGVEVEAKDLEEAIEKCKNFEIEEWGKEYEHEAVVVTNVKDSKWNQLWPKK